MLCVRWYLRYSLSYGDLEEIMAERGLSVDHVTIWRSVQRYAPILNQRIRRELRHPNRSWRVDETYVRVAGSWEKRIVASPRFRSVEGAGRTIEGYEAMHAIRKGQIRWLAKGDAVGQRQFIHALFSIAA